MAKTISANFGQLDHSERTFAGVPILSDGAERGWRELNRNQNWVVSERIKNRHVSGWWGSSGADIRETGTGSWVTRLEFRITPRRHVARLRIWLNCDTDGANGKARIVTPAGNTGTLNFAAAHAPGNEQTATTVVTVAAPPATQLVQVQLDSDASAFIALRWLTISDDYLVLGDMP